MTSVRAADSPGHGLGQQFVEGESGAQAGERAEAMSAAARAQGLEATAQPAARATSANARIFAPHGPDSLPWENTT